MLNGKSLRGSLALALTAIVTLTSCSSGTGEPEGSASLLRVRLMSPKQYTQTVAYLFGSDIADAVPSPLPPLTRNSGLLASSAASIGVTSDQLQQIQTAATAIATKVVDEEHRDFLLPCKPKDEKAADAACASKFLQQTGRLWFRRSMEKERLDRFVNAANSAADQLKDFYAGLAISLEGMLVSPDALFIVDSAEADPDNK